MKKIPKKKIILNDLAASMNDLKVLIKDSYEKLEGLIDALAISTAKGFASMEERLGARIDAVDERLSARIDGVEGSLTVRINTVEENLISQIRGVNNRLDDMSISYAKSDTVRKLDVRVTKLEHGRGK